MVVKSAVCVEGIVPKHISGFFGFLTEFCHSLRPGFNERVQFLGRLTENGHCNRITLGFIFHFTEGVDNFPIHGIAVTHITLGIINGNSELMVSLGHFVHLGGNRL